MKRDSHPDWCAQDHRCGLGEHRSEPLVIDLGRAGSIVATRVLTTRTGRERLEITHSLRLHPETPTRHAAYLMERLTALVETTAVGVERATAQRAASPSGRGSTAQSRPDRKGSALACLPR